MSYSYRFFSLLLLVAVISGCSQDRPPAPVTSTDAARQALVTALDAWKAGTDTQALASRDAALYVGDEDWSGGLRLTNYQVLNEGEQFGANVRFQVDLQLANARGSAAKKRASYLVATNPVQSVTRDDSLREE